MVIAFDIDDTIAMSSDFINKALKEYFECEPDLKTYPFTYGYDTNYETLRDFFWMCEDELRRKVLPFPDAKEFIKKMKEKHNVCILTARGYYLNGDINLASRERTIRWLDDNEINYDGIFFVQGKKGNICYRYGIDVIFEDNLHQIEDILEKSPRTKIVFFDSENKKENLFKEYKKKYPKKIFRITNWKEAENIKDILN